MLLQVLWGLGNLKGFRSPSIQSKKQKVDARSKQECTGLERRRRQRRRNVGSCQV